ncbi:MAG: tetratricopeptide repeat protein [Phycisphaerae bacterium]|nr:tetratricopeptide repeat protein [Phycisphaerae bacterium]
MKKKSSHKKKKSSKRCKSDDSLSEEVAWLIGEGIAEAMLCTTPIGDRKIAISRFEEAVELDPNNTEALNLLGQTRLQCGEPSDARDLFDRALACDMPLEDRITLIQRITETYESCEDYTGAISYYRKGLELCGDVADFHDGIGYCYGELGDCAKALEAEQRAIELDPHNAEYHNDLGYTYQQAGQLDKAMVHLGKAVELDPDDQLARNNYEHCKAEWDRAKRQP